MTADPSVRSVRALYAGAILLGLRPRLLSGVAALVGLTLPWEVLDLLPHVIAGVEVPALPGLVSGAGVLGLLCAVGLVGVGAVRGGGPLATLACAVVALVGFARSIWGSYLVPNMWADSWDDPTWMWSFGGDPAADPRWEIYRPGYLRREDAGAP